VAFVHRGWDCGKTLRAPGGPGRRGRSPGQAYSSRSLKPI
jgi:hypothetical protein